ncbi:FAD-dependent monooxygenase [Geodermatophilus sabuli]|uniref:2-polyprenyl-6-methoxyphenol hydroxylase n=1 Tax=Geodermatophilus sabuli TaxID=1564158 RepID=A0A285EFM8_9ACTN|nr:FAD-dependent monooxygenase [Geodermatophilus sabuli]MBB3086571.1 2-polyprenyl-6-methoxyphenol hydroxylase-like FAD-dependent oxidoreductase [Geodermatophilus sabuli]SNX97777.1 2-polyprenyl-6-methoxyphenol hydroxylase [Geodermatophilus sabuli]
MTSTRRIETQVAVVGGGPVGTGLAIALGQRGVRCVVLERRPEPQPVPKGQNLTQRTMEHMRAWGVEERVRAGRLIPAGQAIGGITAYGSLLGEYSYEWHRRAAVRRFYAADNERLPQYATERALRARVAELPTVSVHYGARAEEVTQDDRGARVSARDASGEVLEVDARYVVGCDGSRSGVREAAGIPQTRTDHEQLMVLLVFRSAQLHDLLERFPGTSYFNVLNPELEGYWQFLGRVDARDTWFFHAPVDHDTAVPSTDFRPLVWRTVGTEFDVEVQHVGFWDMRFALADRYRAGRVFVAGDAAHSHPPYGGYGINTGFEDAANLAWKLGAVVEGWAGDGLLDSYDAERRPVFASTRDDFIARSIEVDREFLASHDPGTDRPGFEAAWTARATGAPAEVDAYEPHYEGSPVVAGGGSGTPSASGRHEARARAGHHLAAQPEGTGVDLFDELTGGGFVLLRSGTAGEELVAAAARASVPLRVVDVDDAVRAAYGADLVLVRPDQYVAWAGDRCDDADALLATVTGHSAA